MKHKRSREINTTPANNNWQSEKTGPRKYGKPAASTRKEFPSPPDGPEEFDEGYFKSLRNETLQG